MGVKMDGNTDGVWLNGRFPTDAFDNMVFFGNTAAQPSSACFLHFAP